VPGYDDVDKWKVLDTAKKSRVARMFGAQAMWHYYSLEWI